MTYPPGTLLQYLQLFNLLLILFIAYQTETFSVASVQLIWGVLWAIAVEAATVYSKGKQVGAALRPSPVITALGVMLMLYAASWYIYAVVIGIGIVQKRFGHGFNPSNAAVIAAITLFPQQALLRMGQLGYDAFFAYMVIFIGIVTLLLARRILISVTFTAVYVACVHLFVWHNDPTAVFEDMVLHLFSVSFLVFLFFMLTDPKTTPTHPTEQILFGALTACFAVVLDVWHGWHLWHLFAALFAITPLFVLRNKCKKRQKKCILRTATLMLLISALILYLQTFSTKVAGYPL